MSFGLSAGAIGLIGAGASVASGVLGAKSASKAAGIQGQATADASAENARQFDRSIELQQNSIDTGDAARNRLATLLGLSTPGNFNGAAYLAANPDVAADSYFAANPYEHYTQYGQSEGRANGSVASGGGAADITTDPGYQFRLQQGQQALDSRAAAGGGYFSGAALKAASAYNSGQASQEYGNITNRLAGLAGAGQTASTTAGQIGTNYAATNADLLTNSANAQAASGIAGTNAISSGINSGLNSYYQNNLLSQLTKRG